MYKKFIGFFCVLFFTFSVFAQTTINLLFSKEELANYKENGYIVVKNLFLNYEIDEITKNANELKLKALELGKKQEEIIMDGGSQFVLSHGKNKEIYIKRVVWAGASKPRLLDYGQDLRITSRVSQILGSYEADHLINQLHYKLPHDKVHFLWHIDLQNRKAFDPEWEDINKNGSFVQVITAIDEHTLNNGPIKILEGSHKTILDFPRFSKTSELPKNIDISKAKPLLLSPGDTVFMHPYLLHSSAPNDSETERKTFINGFSAPGANHKPYPGEGSAKLIKLGNRV